MDSNQIKISNNKNELKPHSFYSFD